jgi:hypothetical protein
MRISQIMCLLICAAELLPAPAVPQAQTPSAFLAVQKIAADPSNSRMLVTLKNVGNLKVTACGLVASSRQYTYDLFYSIGMEARLALSRPSGFGGIQPGESADLLLPVSQNKTLTAEINAVILEDRTAVGDESVIASMFRQRMAFASEWGRWALVMGGSPSQRTIPAGPGAERADMLRGLKAPSNERGDTATVLGRMAARKALTTLLAQALPENGASLREYVEERSASLRLHAQRTGTDASFSAVSPLRAFVRANLAARPAISAVKREEFSCRYPGQLFGIVGRSDVVDGGTGTTRAGSGSKVDELAITATGACGIGNAVPTCNPEFVTAMSSSSSSAAIVGLSTTYIAGLGCAVSGTLAAERETGLTAARGRMRPQIYDPCSPGGGGGGGGGGTASDCVSVADASTLFLEDSAGTRGWHLIAEATGRDGKTHGGEFGDGYAYGMWVQAYTDCSGTHHDTFPLMGEGIPAGRHSCGPSHISLDSDF